MILQTELGQLLDLTSQPMDGSKVDLARFTLQRYRLIVKYKTAFYTFYLPIVRQTASTTHTPTHPTHSQAHRQADRRASRRSRREGGRAG